MIPPRELMFDGPADAFEENGRESFKIYTDVCHLKPHETMLDVGCGIGRKTLPLLGWLTGRYEGFDCKRVGVEWCRDHIRPEYPNFYFTFIDLKTPGYNPDGALLSSDFKFPYDDNIFDFVAVNSVFTHMLHKDIQHYLREIHRVLKPGGRCLISWFIAFKGTENPGVPHDVHGVGLCANKAFPEQQIAYYGPCVTDFYRQAGLEIGKVDFGYWRGTPGGLGHQDLILAHKPG